MTPKEFRTQTDDATDTLRQAIESIQHFPPAVIAASLCFITGAFLAAVAKDKDGLKEMLALANRSTTKTARDKYLARTRNHQ